MKQPWLSHVDFCHLNANRQRWLHHTVNFFAVKSTIEVILSQVILALANLSLIPLKLSFRYILYHEKKTPKDAVTPEPQSKFTPKMKANTVLRLLSSLV